MQIVVNHVTRMKTEERICVAGIDAATFEKGGSSGGSTDSRRAALHPEASW